MERIIKAKIMEYLYKYNLITPSQHGFVSNKSCTTNLLETLDIITSCSAINIAVDILYADYAKAFDKVNHRFLCFKLLAYGFGEKIRNWINSFLTNRKQRVVIGKIMSRWSRVRSGVPQGSVLGPVLFIIFINDLCDLISNPMKLFADDSKIICKILDEYSTMSLQNDIDKLLDWTIKWKLLLNGEKCKIMHIGQNNPNANYYLFNDNEQSTIKTTVMEKDLGVHITNDLKWQHQCEYASNSANKALGIVKGAFKKLDIKQTKILYTSFVRPLLEFAIPAWNPNLIGDSNKLEKVQRRATKIPIETKKLDYGDRLKAFNLQTLSKRRERGDLIQQFKIETGQDKIMWSSEQYRTPSLKVIGPANAIRGHKKRLVKEKTSNNTRRNFFRNRVVNNWNSLDNETVESKNVNIFKANLDKWFQKDKSATAH
jgi:hypothetical protein